MNELINFIQNYVRESGPAGIFLLVLAAGFWGYLIARVVLDIFYIFRNHRSW